MLEGLRTLLYIFILPTPYSLPPNNVACGIGHSPYIMSLQIYILLTEDHMTTESNNHKQNSTHQSNNHNQSNSGNKTGTHNDEKRQEKRTERDEREKRQERDEREKKEEKKEERRIDRERKDIKRQGRFSWVKRLMQNKQVTPNSRDGSYFTTSNSSMINNSSIKERSSNVRHDTYSQTNHTNPNQTKHTNPNYANQVNQIDQTNQLSYANGNITNNDRNIDETLDVNSLNSFSDNISTIPLKSIMSVQSTKSPSILSNDHDASTTQTSLINHNREQDNILNNRDIVFVGNINRENRDTDSLTTNAAVANDRDTESVLTLASSRIRRRSIDTDCSTTGIAPASIMERVPIHPNSSHAPSIKTNDPSYDSPDVQSSIRSNRIDEEDKVRSLESTLVTS